ncbi:MAG: TrkH family potassium uptake protein [Sulfolobales archaeon]
MRRIDIFIGFQHIISSLTRILFVLSLIILIPAVVGMIYGEIYAVRVMLLLGILLLTPSYIISRILGPPTQINLSSALLIAGISWLIVPLIGALPYYFICNTSLINAYFESMSGFTTTGMTIFSNIESLPKTILFWRSLTQWVGGLGIILLFIIIAGPLSGIDLLRLYTAEARELKLRASTWVTVRDLWIIYLFYTAVCFLLLWMFGMNLFDALTHSFTAIATGGFSTKDNSIATYNNPTIELILTIFEFLGATSFVAHYSLFKFGPRAFFKYYEVRYYLFLLSTSSLVIMADHILNRGMDILNAFRISTFQVVSMVTTTGYLTSDINLWPPLSKFLIVVLMLIGGNLCSTGGAIKLGRIIIALKVVVNQLEHLYLSPSTVKPVKVDTHMLENEDITRIFTFLTIYFALLGFGTLIFTSFGYEPFAALSAVASAQGNIGPAYVSLLDMGELPKTLLIIHMWLGRLELLPAIAVFIPQMWIQSRRRIL